MHDPKLVEALARTWFIGWRPGHTWETATQDHRDRLLKTAREFFNRHRLVQLPEEPDGWVDPVGIEANPVGLTLRLTVEETRGSRPVYILPGDPQEVDDD